MDKMEYYKIPDISSFDIPDNKSCNRVVYMCQNDFEDVAYGSGSVSSCGCGVAATAMAVSYCLGSIDRRKWVSPAEILAMIAARTGDKNTHYTWYKGSNHDIACHVASYYSLPSSGVLEPHSLTEEQVIRRLRSGQAAVASCGAGIFTREGHFICITGCDASGNIYVNDPNGAHAGYCFLGFRWSTLLSPNVGHFTSITFLSPMH